MDKDKRAKLEASGWVVGTPRDLLVLSPEDDAFVDMKVALAAALRQRRIDQHLTQVQAAKIIHSSQSRLAKMEIADRSVTIDLLIRSFLRLGGTREDVAATLL